MEVYKTVVYKPFKPRGRGLPYIAETINSDEKEDYLKNGWYDSPADFPKEEEEEEKREDRAEREESPNFSRMSKPELLKFAEEKLELDLDGRRSRENLISVIESALNED